MNVLKLTPADLTALLYAYSIRIESCVLAPKPWNKCLYAAVYDVVLVDDGSFPDGDDRAAEVYIYFERNGTITAEL